MSISEAISAANLQIDEGDESSAFDVISDALEYPATVAADSLAAALDVLARAATEMLGDEWGAAIAPAAAASQDSGALGAAGAFLVEQGFAGLAVTVLAHAVEVAPDDLDLLAELVTAHEQLGDHAGAVRVLDAARATDGEAFLPAYLLAFNAMMSFDPERARTVRQRLLDDAGDDTERFMADRIDGMLARLDALAGAGFADPPRTDLQAWHLIRTGGLLLDLAVPGERDWGDARGSTVVDSVAACREAIGRVHSLLMRSRIVPSTVLTVPDDSSQVLAIAAAEILSLSTASWVDDSETAGLVVIYDIERLRDHVSGALAIHEADQVVWAHADRWTMDHAVTPDIATFFHQRIERPWAEQMPDDVFTDDGAAATWAAQIVASEPTTDGTDDRLVEMAASTQPLGAHAAGIFRASGRREKQFAVPLPIDPF